MTAPEQPAPKPRTHKLGWRQIAMLGRVDRGEVAPSEVQRGAGERVMESLMAHGLVVWADDFYLTNDGRVALEAYRAADPPPPASAHAMTCTAPDCGGCQ